MNVNELLDWGRQVLAIEAETLQNQLIDQRFAHMVQLIAAAPGRLICSGVGKSGHIAAKAAATFASTGTAAFFMHPSEAGHGDLGMVCPGDLVLFLSNSGESGEIGVLLPALKNMQVPVLAITANENSTLARAAAEYLLLKITREACPLDLAPTSSTTASLALCDALAVALMKLNNFQRQDFARSHPLGRLGRRLTLRVADVMVSADLPRNGPEQSIGEALFQLSKGYGASLIMAGERLAGIFTDGDLRRALTHGVDLHRPLATVMTAQPQTIGADAMAVAALDLMTERRISLLPVLDGGQVVGLVQLHKLAEML